MSFILYSSLRSSDNDWFSTDFYSFEPKYDENKFFEFRDEPKEIDEKFEMVSSNDNISDFPSVEPYDLPFEQLQDDGLNLETNTSDSLTDLSTFQKEFHTVVGTARITCVHAIVYLALKNLGASIVCNSGSEVEFQVDNFPRLLKNYDVLQGGLRDYEAKLRLLRRWFLNVPKVSNGPVLTCRLFVKTAVDDHKVEQVREIIARIEKGLGFRVNSDTSVVKIMPTKVAKPKISVKKQDTLLISKTGSEKVLPASKTPIIDAFVYCALKKLGASLVRNTDKQIQFQINDWACLLDNCVQIEHKGKPTKKYTSRIKTLRRWFSDIPRQINGKLLPGTITARAIGARNVVKKLQKIIEATSLSIKNS